MWDNGWQERLENRLAELGHDSLSSLLASHPGETYESMAALLGNESHAPAPIQLISVQYAEARRAGTVRHAAMDALCRVLRERFPEGWGTGDNVEFRTVSALSGWSSEILETGQQPQLESVLDAVIDAMTATPPAPGWLPASTSDSYIDRIFEISWPTNMP